MTTYPRQRDIGVVAALRLVLPLVAFLIAGLSYGEAHARRGIMVVTSGDSITQVAELDAEVAEEVEAELGPGIAVGYKYEQFGLFWVELWCWNGSYVLFRGDEYWELPDDGLAAAAGVQSLDALSKPWTYSVPPGLIVVALALLGFGAFAVFSKSDEDEDEDEAQSHASPPGYSPVAGPAVDPRYQAALATYHADAGGAHEHKLAAAMALLNRYGIPSDQAYPALMHLLTQQAQPTAAPYPAGQG